MSALAVVSAVALALASLASAEPRYSHARSRPGHADQINSSLALQWYDITNQTVEAAAFPESVTQSRTWSVSWLAAARAVRGSQITQEVIDARVWEGIHFRFSDTVGATVGGKVADYDLGRLRSIGL